MFRINIGETNVKRRSDGGVIVAQGNMDEVG